MREQNGFTLIQLMIVVTIIGIFASLAAPNFTDSLQRNKVRKTTDYFSQEIALARATALDTNQDVTIEIINNRICITSPPTSIPPSSCNLRNDSLEIGVTANLTDISNASITRIIVDHIYGKTTPVNAKLIISNGSHTQTSTINILGLVNVGNVQ